MPPVLLLFLPVTAASGAELVPHPDVAAMMEAVRREDLEPVVRALSGEDPVIVGGVETTFTTRSSSSGEAIDLAEQYVYEQLASYGLDAVEYHEFPAELGAPPGRNVIGQLDGTTRPDEIVVLGAHLDDKPWVGRAPGADDDASGVAATLLLARTFAGRRFQRTLRFVLFGAEENAPWECTEIGSAGYAARCRTRGENVVAMIQADAIAYDPEESAAQVVEMNTRRPEGDPGGRDQAIYETWAAAIQAYGIEDLEPTLIAVGNNWSDHGSFWNNGYPAVMLSAEEWAYWNPHWHTADDTVHTLDWPFYVQVARSYLAVAAHLALLEGMEGDTGTTPDDSAEPRDTDAPARPPDGCACAARLSPWPGPLPLLLALLSWGCRRARPVGGPPRPPRQIPAP